MWTLNQGVIVDTMVLLWILAGVLLVLYLYVRSRRKAKEKKYRDF